MNITYYILKDPRNEEIRYVGRTKNDLKTRLNGHINKQGSLGHKFYWIKQLKGLGLKPIIEEIDSIEIEDTNEDWLYAYNIEQYWISQFITWGFKLTNHNDRGSGYFRKSWVKKGKKIFKYNLDGELLSEYISIKQASIMCNLHSKTIQCGIKRNSIVSKIYIFSEDKFIEPKRSNFKLIHQYSIDGTLIKTHYNDREIKSLNFKIKSIRSNCNNEIKSCYGFIWSYGVFIKSTRKEQKCRVILQYDLNNCLIKEWTSAKEVVKFNTNYNDTKIRSVCRGVNKTHKGFIWKYKI